MNYPIDLLALSSFKEYLDHSVVKKLAAWKNATVPLFLDAKQDRMSGYKKAACGPNQWLYDSSIVGATIADPNQFSHASWKAAKTDFKNGRFIVPASTAAPLPTTATLALKHFNSYLSTRDDTELLNSVKFDLEPEMIPQTEGTAADLYYGPCYFVKLVSTKNEPFAYDGLDKTIFNVRVAAFVKTEAELLSLASIFRDLKNTNTKVLNETPLNEFYDLKEKPWSFDSAITEAQNNGNLTIWVDEANFSPLRSDNMNTKLKNTFIGVGNFTISIARYPRQ